jgi:hypothetical protein
MLTDNQQQHRSQNRIRGSMFNRTVGSKGKFKPKHKLESFWKHYYSGKYAGTIPFSKASKVIADVYKEFSKLLLEDDYVYLPKLGFFGIAETTKSKKYRMINWPETEKLWKKMYGELEPSEFKKILDKPLLEYPSTTHTSRANKICWVKNQSSGSYKFLAICQTNRQVAKKAQENGLLLKTVIDFNIYIDGIRKNSLI